MMMSTYVKNKVNAMMERHAGHFQKYFQEMERFEPFALARHPGDAERMHESYLNVVRLGEKLTKELREIFMQCYGDMEAMGINKGRSFTSVMTEEYPIIDIDGRMVRVVFDPMLPGRLKGSCHYIHEKLNIGIAGALAEMGNPQIRFARAAVIFIHKSTPGAIYARHVKDYDNVERTCVINTLVKYFLDDDNSRQIFTMDLAAEADANRTEVYLMEPSAFMDFLTGLDYSLYGEDLRDVMNGHA